MNAEVGDSRFGPVHQKQRIISESQLSLRKVYKTILCKMIITEAAVGGDPQLFIKGCDSEISSMVTEAQRKVADCMNVALKTIGLLAAMNGTDLHLSELGSEDINNRSVVDSLQDGMHQSVTDLLFMGLRISSEMVQDTQMSRAGPPIQQSAIYDVAHTLKSYFDCCLSERSGSTENCSEEEGGSELCDVHSTTVKLLKLNKAIKDLHSSLSRYLRGSGDAGLSQSIQSSSKTIDDVINGLLREMDGRRSGSLQLPCVKNVMVARDKVHSALQALQEVFDKCTDGMQRLGTDRNFVQQWYLNGNSKRTVPKVVYSLSSGISTCSRDARWV